MKPLFSLRKMRFTAGVMLCLWLLASGVAVANACLAHEEHAHAGHVGASAMNRSGTSDIGPGTALPIQTLDAPGGAPGDDDLLESAACRAYCTAAQTAVAKHKAGVLADLQVEPVLVSSNWRSLDLLRPEAGVPEPVAPARPQPPAFIRFLRLNL